MIKTDLIHKNHNNLIKNSIVNNRKQGQEKNPSYVYKHNRGKSVLDFYRI